MTELEWHLKVKTLLRKFWSENTAPWRLSRIAVIFCVVFVTAIMLFEESLIFFPSKYPDGDWKVGGEPLREGDIVPDLEDCWFKTEDGVTLHGWFCTPRIKAAGNLAEVPAEMVVLWFHGNAGNITDRYNMLKQMVVALPVRVFIVDYRGYGRSEGSPSESGLYIDAQAAWNYLTGGRGIAPEKIILFGKSLGGVPAVDLATKVSPAGLIVQSSFTSAADMAKTLLPLVGGLIIRTKMDSLSKIGRVSCPKLFIHSPADEVVPYDLGRRLFEAASEPKEFYEVHRSLHNDTYIIGGKAYFDVIKRFVESRAKRNEI